MFGATKQRSINELAASAALNAIEISRMVSTPPRIPYSSMRNKILFQAIPGVSEAPPLALVVARKKKMLLNEETHGMVWLNIWSFGGFAAECRQLLFSPYLDCRNLDPAQLQTSLPNQPRNR